MNQARIQTSAPHYSKVNIIYHHCCISSYFYKSLALNRFIYAETLQSRVIKAVYSEKHTASNLPTVDLGIQVKKRIVSTQSWRSRYCAVEFEVW